MPAGHFAGEKNRELQMTPAFFDQVKSLTLAAFVSVTSVIMLVSIAGLNGAVTGEWII